MADQFRIMISCKTLNDRRNDIRAIFAWSTFAILGLVLMAGQARGQDIVEVADEYYLPIPHPQMNDDEKSALMADPKYKEAKKKISADSRLIDDILESNGSTGNPTFTDFFDKYVFPSMARKENENRLGELRAEFLKDYLSSKVSGGARGAMINLTIDRMKKYSEDPSLSAAARLNSIYLIGLLDATPPNRIASQFPVPEPKAMAVMKDILLSQDKKLHPDYLKVAALAGIKRHVDIDYAMGGSIVSGADKTAIIDFATAQFQQPSTDDFGYWMKRRSLQIGGLTGSLRVIDLALGVLKAEKGSLWIRFDAIEALSRLPIDSAPQAKQIETLKTVGQFLKKHYVGEASAIRAAADKLVHDSILFGDVDLETNPSDYDTNTSTGTGGSKSGAPGGGAGGGMGGGAGGEGDDSTGGFGGGFGGPSPTGEAVMFVMPNYQLHTFRRKIKAFAYTAQLAMKKLDRSNSVTGKEKAFLTSLLNDLTNLLDEGSYFGVVDLDEDEEEPEPGAEPDPAPQEQLALACESFAKNVGIQLDKMNGVEKPQEEKAAAGDGQPEFPGGG